MSLFKRLKRKGVPDDKTKREGNLSSSPVSPANVAELRPPSSSTESYSNVKHLATPNRPMNYTLENTTLFEGLNVTGVKASSSDKDTDSQGSADTSRSQHTDVASELSSVPDKNDDSQLNHSDHDDHNDHESDGVKGSSFSFVRSDSMASKDGESSGDENQTQFAFIKEEDVTDDVIDDAPPSKSQEHESIKPEAENVSPLAGKISSEVDHGHISEPKVTSVDHKLTIAHIEKDFIAQNNKLKTTSVKPLSLADTLKTSSDEHVVQSSAPLTIGKVTPTAPVTKSAVAKKKRRAKRPGQSSQWKHEETPLDEIQMARELHQTSSSSLLELKEPLNDIPEDNEEACTPSEDRVLAMSAAADNITVIPAIQIEVTPDNSSDIIRKPSLSTIPEIQIMSDDASDNETTNEKGSTDNLSISSETTIPVANQNDSSPTELITVTSNDSENNQGDSKEDIVDNSLDTSPQLKTTDYGIELSPEDKITLLVQTTDSKLNDIQVSCDKVVANSNKSINGNIAMVAARIKKRKEYQQLREQEAACIAEENYELAEELGAKMESLSMELECKLENTSEEVYKFMTDQLKILEEEKKLRNELVEKLKDVKCDEEEKLQKVEKEFSLLQLKEKKKLATIEDHIKREKGYIGLDREHVLKAEASYKSERDERCADYLAKKTSLSEEMSTLQEQIAEVEKQLAALREKETVLTTALNEEDAKVKTVEDEMYGEKQHIDTEWEKIHKREAELQDDINELEVNKSSYQKIEGEHNKTQQSHQQLVDTLHSWITTHHDRLRQLDQSNEVLQSCHGKVTAVTTRASTPELNQLEEEKRSMNHQVKELTNKVFTVQTQMSQIQKTHSDINNRIPQLNEAKKAAVASRQYREAGQISQQIKALTQQLEEEQQQMSLLETELSSHTAQLLSLNQQVANMEAKIVSLRKEKDVTFLQRIFQQCRQLIEEANSNPSIPRLLDFLRSYSKLCRVLADEICIKYSVELSDLELDVINIADDKDDVQITTAENKSPNGNSSSLVLDNNTSNISAKEIASNSGPVNSSREEIEQEIANVESQIDSAVNSEDFELAATLDDKLKSLKETLKHI